MTCLTNFNGKLYYVIPRVYFTFCMNNVSHIFYSHLRQAEFGYFGGTYLRTIYNIIKLICIDTNTQRESHVKRWTFNLVASFDESIWISTGAPGKTVTSWGKWPTKYINYTHNVPTLSERLFKSISILQPIIIGKECWFQDTINCHESKFNAFSDHSSSILRIPALRNLEQYFIENLPTHHTSLWNLRTIQTF